MPPENIVILEPGDVRAQKVAKAMASQTAGDILGLLREGPKSLTDITERLALPITTTKYHVENLLEAGIITVSQTKYSVKGREVKIYSLTDQLLIVAPAQANIRSIILKYASLSAIVIAGSLAIAALLPLLQENTLPEAVPLATAAVRESDTSGSGAVMAAKAAYANALPPAQAGIDPALAFLCGGALVIFILLCYEAVLWRRSRK